VTDATASPTHGGLLAADARTRRRRAAEARFKAYGIAAIALSLVTLAVMWSSILADVACRPSARRRWTFR
jgi:phosphate transport system permease protein